MRLGTKLALFLLVIIILVLTGHGYFNILSRRDILVRMMKVEVESIGKTLRISLEELAHFKEKGHVKNIIDAIDEYEKTLGVIVYFKEEDLLFRSRSLDNGIEPYIELIKKSIHEDSSQEGFGMYKEEPVFSYTLPFKNRTGQIIGGISILQHTSFAEDDIHKAEWEIFLTMFILTGATVGMILFVTRRWISVPIAQLMDGIKNLSKGNLNTQIELVRGKEFSTLAQTFNQMTINLKAAREEIIREAEARLHLERELRQSEKLAVVGQLASELAHDIGTPLNIISGRIELIKERLEKKEEAQKDLDVVVQQTERIMKIIQQLLGFVRKKRPEERAVSMGPLLETTLEFLDYLIRKQKVTVVKEFGGSLPPVIGDLDQLHQVFSNLLLNALQAMPQGGTLRVSVSAKRVSKEGLKKGERFYIEVAIEDTGVGIKNDMLENIFKPFFTTKEEDKGTGLGLTVSQGIVEAHEGWIEVKSQVGKGSVFRVYLPALQEKNGGDERSPNSGR